MGVSRGDDRMWGFVADSVSDKLCRGYAAVLGGFPRACLSNSGTPMLAITAIVLAAVFVILMVGRSALRRS